MSGHHAQKSVERHCDVAVVGGSAAGLAAALELGRRRRSVIVVDAGEPTAAAREEVRRHGVEVLDGRVLQVTHLDDGRFRLELTGGHSIVARRAVADTGVVDDLPGIDVLAELDLAEDAALAAGGPSGNQADWDHRYSGEQMWSGSPNGTLVNEVSGLAPGRALDVGAGEGGDAVWLAEQGWKVTASDISQRALDRVGAEAKRRGLDLEYLHVDANRPGAYEAGAFDLVSAQYASIPRTPDGVGVRNLLDAVAADGTLLVVSHDLEPMRAPIDTSTDSRAFDPDAYVRVDDFAAALADAPGWDIEVHEQRPRPAGAASSHHVDDIVLRARRRAS